MAYEPLHHKYRPQTFADLVGQGAIAATLSEAIATVRIAPAYLFCGPRGTGKTSSARIFAKSLNCGASSQPTPTPCGQCEICRAIAAGTAMDVIEIDAASNTGVDNIREIIERAQFAPVQGRYKLYLIDEVHMLSTAAFNALLKTLEEPPARVVFVLATTDPQRVLPTIISRCQRFDFRRIPLQEMVSHLRIIADKESIQIADDAIALVAQVANGGLRDAESLLDQLSLLPGEVAIEQVWDLVGAIPERELLELLQALRQGETTAIVEQCRRLMDRGREPLAVLQNLAGFFRDLLLAKTAPQQPELAALTAPTWEKLIVEAAQWEISRLLQVQHLLKSSEGQIRHSTQPRLWLEVTLLTLCQPEVAYGLSRPAPLASPSRDRASAPASSSRDRAPTSGSNLAPQAPPPVEQNGRTPTPAPAPQAPPPAEQNGRSPAPVTQPAREPTPERSPGNENTERVWEQVLACIKLPMNRALFKQHCRLLAFDGQKATVGVRNSKLYQLAANKKPSLDEAFERAFQRQIGVALQVGITPPSPAAPEARDALPERDRPSPETVPTPERDRRSLETPPAVIPAPSTTEARVSGSPPAKPPPQPLDASPPQSSSQLPDTPRAVPARSERREPAAPTPERRQSVPSAKPTSNALSQLRSPVPTAPEPEPVAPESQEEAMVPSASEPSDLLQKELFEAATSLAKAMEGEVISLDDADWDIPDELPQPVAPELPSASLSPDEGSELDEVGAAFGGELPENADEEDIPFRRPQWRSRSLELRDPWELP